MIVGGFPCQDISIMGKRAGLSGARSGLIAEVMRLLDETSSPFVFLENVPLLVKNGLRKIVSNLTKRGFTVSWAVIPASSIGAVHIRKRIFILGRRADRTFTIKPYVAQVSWATKSEPARMVLNTTADHRLKRVMLLGNSVVPDAVRAAFLVLSSGFRLTPAETMSISRLAAFKDPDPSCMQVVPKGGEMPRWGHATGSKIYRLIELPYMALPSLSLTISPKSFVSKRRQIVENPSRTVTAPIHMSAWSTPRSVTCGAHVLTERMARDLPTQVRYEEDTPEKLRSGQVSATFVEWMMGYPKGWTRMPRGHVSVMPTGYRPNLKKRPAFESL